MGSGTGVRWCDGKWDGSEMVGWGGTGVIWWDEVRGGYGVRQMSGIR